MVRFCTVPFREVPIQSLRDTTEGLLWQAGLRQASSKPPKK
jgi:hypothetical protein